MSTTIGDDDQNSAAPSAFTSSGLDIKALLDCITTLAGENVTAQRDLVEKEKQIKELEEQLAQALEQPAGHGVS